MLAVFDVRRETSIISPRDHWRPLGLPSRTNAHKSGTLLCTNNCVSLPLPRVPLTRQYPLDGGINNVES